MSSPIITIPYYMPISDPGYPTAGPGTVVLVTLALSWLWGVALFNLIGGATLNEIRDEMTGWLIRFAVFVGLASVPMYYYPRFDGWWYARFEPYWTGLTIYSPERFGIVHIPTLVLLLQIMLAALAVPHVARGISALVDNQVARYVANRQAELAEIEAEEAAELAAANREAEFLRELPGGS